MSQIMRHWESSFLFRTCLEVGLSIPIYDPHAFLQERLEANDESLERLLERGAHDIRNPVHEGEVVSEVGSLLMAEDRKGRVTDVKLRLARIFAHNLVFSLFHVR